jgi:hypothetical protein
MRRCGAPAGVFLTIAICALASWLLLGCGAPTETAPNTQPTAVDTVPSDTFPHTVVIDSPAVVIERAQRVTTLPLVVETAAPTTTVDPDAAADATYSGLPCHQWAGEAIAAGWPVDLIPKVLRTMWRESRCQPEVRSTTSDSGLLQINDIVLRDHRFRRDWPNFDPATLFDPNVNLAVALWLYGVDGWAPWRGGA